jgi:hypothetical protein
VPPAWYPSQPRLGCGEHCTRPGQRRACFRIQASCNAAPVNNCAFPVSNRAILADIPNNALDIAVVRGGGAPRNSAAPVSGS